MILGFMSVVQMMLELISRAITHRPITILRTRRLRSWLKSPDA